MKLACVVQRYGSDVTGGSETHCRQLAERLAEHHDVHVLTSTARDYLHWRNAFEAGWSQAGPVRVGRFRVARERQLRQLREASERASERGATDDEQRAWFAANGPEVPDLLEYLERHGGEYDLVLFWAYRYYQSFFGVPLVADRAVLVPTAEEDPVLDFPVLRGFFGCPRGLMFLTEEERLFVTARAGGRIPRNVVIGTGIEPRRLSNPATLDALGIDEPFLLYVGRVDVNKGCDTLLEYFSRYAATDERGVGGRPGVTLVLAGPVHMPLVAHPRVRVLGFVSDEIRDALLDRALALVMSSPYESLSIALLEGWNHARPAIVNARCSVLRGQVGRANGGLHYATYREFAEAVSMVVERPDAAARLGQQGAAYVEAEYRWPTVLARVETFLDSIRPSSIR